MVGALSEQNNVGAPSTVGLKKLSKSSDDDTLERRNKSYSKVLDAQIEWIRLKGEGKFDAETAAYDKWKAKSAWHEKEFGW